MLNRKKHKNADETLKIIKKILYDNKDAQKSFQLASKVDKGKSKPKPEESIAERTKLRKRRIAEIEEEEEKNKKNKLLEKYFTNFQSPRDMYIKLQETEGERNKYQVYSIKEVLNRIEEAIKNVSEDKKSIIEENEKIINIVECILYFNQLEQQRGGRLKILTPN